MENKINQYLTEIEQAKQVKILLACETGSRAWGFPSPDSDYDVRLIYHHPQEWYLSLSESKDTIEQMLDQNEVDISGWDLRKSLRLIWKSNPPLLERIQSHIVYRQDDAFMREILQLATQCYSRIATIFHYLSMAKKGLEELQEQEQYKLKKFFYALRAATACKWILDREEMPPIYFPTMMEGVGIQLDTQKRIRELIELKAGVSESYWHRGEKDLVKLMQSWIERAEKESNRLPASKIKAHDLDAFFIKTITQK